MTTPAAPYDIIALLTLAGGIIFSNPQLAEAVAPHAVVCFAALIGGLYALSRKTADQEMPNKRKKSAVFLLRIVGMALIVTIPAATLIAPHLGLEESRFLFAPLALLLGAIGDERKEFLEWCFSFVMRWKNPKQGE